MDQYAARLTAAASPNATYAGQNVGGLSAAKADIQRSKTSMEMLADQFSNVLVRVNVLDSRLGEFMERIGGPVLSCVESNDAKNANPIHPNALTNLQEYAASLAATVSRLEQRIEKLNHIA